LAEIFHPIMELVCSKAMKTSLLQGNFTAPMRALGALVSFKSLAILFTRHRNFNLPKDRISQPFVTGKNVSCLLHTPQLSTESITLDGNRNFVGSIFSFDGIERR